MARLLKQGQGWRIGYNPEAITHQGLIGGEDWAFELTKSEFNDFCRLIQQIASTMSQMATELMDAEKISCEVETDLIWLEAEGYPNSYSLRLILNQGRCCEGNWSQEAVKELVSAVQMFSVF